MKTHKFLAMWDMLGLECLFDYDKIEQEKVVKILKGESPDGIDIPLTCLILRAQSNSQRHYEIYAFESELAEEEIKDMFEYSPQIIVDAIRSAGVKVYSNRASYKERVIV